MISRKTLVVLFVFIYCIFLAIRLPCFNKLELRWKAECTDEAVPDDMEDEAVEKAADGGQEAEWERLLLFIHLNLIKDSETHSSYLVTFIEYTRRHQYSIIIIKYSNKNTTLKMTTTKTNDYWYDILLSWLFTHIHTYIHKFTMRTTVKHSLNQRCEQSLVGRC